MKIKYLWRCYCTRTLIGASGARLVTTLVNALEQENKRTGIATACIGGGLGIALMIDKGE